MNDKKKFEAIAVFFSSPQFSFNKFFTKNFIFTSSASFNESFSLVCSRKIKSSLLLWVKNFNFSRSLQQKNPSALMISIVEKICCCVLSEAKWIMNRWYFLFFSKKMKSSLSTFSYTLESMEHEKLVGVKKEAV